MKRHLQLSALALAAITLFPSCDGESPAAPSLPDGDVTPFTLHAAPTSGLTMSQRVVVRTEAELATIWEQIFSDVAMPDEIPVVDFNRDMVLVVASGEKPESCNTIEITSAFGDGTDLTATVTETGPSAGCDCAATLSQPVEVARVPRANEVNFLELLATSCPI